MVRTLNVLASERKQTDDAEHSFVRHRSAHTQTQQHLSRLREPRLRLPNFIGSKLGAGNSNNLKLNLSHTRENVQLKAFCAQAIVIDASAAKWSPNKSKVDPKENQLECNLLHEREGRSAPFSWPAPLLPISHLVVALHGACSSSE